MIIKGKKHGNELYAIFDRDKIVSTTICGGIMKGLNPEIIVEIFDFISGSIAELEKWVFYGGKAANES